MSDNADGRRRGGEKYVFSRQLSGHFGSVSFLRRSDLSSCAVQPEGSAYDRGRDNAASSDSLLWKYQSVGEPDAVFKINNIREYPRQFDHDAINE